MPRPSCNCRATCPAPPFRLADRETLSPHHRRRACRLAGPCLRVATYNIHRACAASGPASVWRSTTSPWACRRSTLTSSSCRRYGTSTTGMRWTSSAPGLAGPRRGRPSSWHRRNYDLPHQCRDRGGEHGNALLSRWPLGDVGHHDVSDHAFEQRGLLHVPVRWQGRRPSPSSSTWVCSTGGACARCSVWPATSSAGAAHVPLIVAGDFNDSGRAPRWPDAPLRAATRLGAGAPPGDHLPVQPAHLLARPRLRAGCAAWFAGAARPSWARMSDHLPPAGGAAARMSLARLVDPADLSGGNENRLLRGGDALFRTCSRPWMRRGARSGWLPIFHHDRDRPAPVRASGGSGPAWRQGLRGGGRLWQQDSPWRAAARIRWQRRGLCGVPPAGPLVALAAAGPVAPAAPEAVWSMAKWALSAASTSSTTASTCITAPASSRAWTSPSSCVARWCRPWGRRPVRSGRAPGWSRDVGEELLALARGPARLVRSGLAVAARAHAARPWPAEPSRLPPVRRLCAARQPAPASHHRARLRGRHQPRRDRGRPRLPLLLPRPAHPSRAAPGRAAWRARCACCYGQRWTTGSRHWRRRPSMPSCWRTASRSTNTLPSCTPRWPWWTTSGRPWARQHRPALAAAQPGSQCRAAGWPLCRAAARRDRDGAGGVAADDLTAAHRLARAAGAAPGWPGSPTSTCVSPGRQADTDYCNGQTTADPHYLRIKTHLKEGHGQRPLGGRRPAASEGPTDHALQDQPHDGQPRARELEQEGLIERVQGRRAASSLSCTRTGRGQVREVADVIAAHGTSTTGWCSAPSAPAPARSDGELGLKRGAPVFVAVVVHRDGGVPLQVETLVVNPRSRPTSWARTSASSSRPATCRSWRRCPRHAPWSKPPCPARTTPVGWPCPSLALPGGAPHPLQPGRGRGHLALGAPGRAPAIARRVWRGRA